MRSLRTVTMAAPIAVLLVGACAASKPPDTLVKARQEFTTAERSATAKYDPSALHDAKTALDRAEKLYKDDDDEKLVSDASYVAMRRAELAKIQGDTVALQTRKDEQVRNAQQAQAKATQQTNTELAETREQLDIERAAREAAEARANEPMARLREQEAAAMQEKPSGTVITISGSLLFASGRSELQPGPVPKLDKIAAVLKEQGDRRIIIRGFTDSTGSDATNAALSKARANEVATYLGSNGVPRDRMTTEGLGEADPVAPNTTKTGRAANRRVEIEVQHAPPK